MGSYFCGKCGRALSNAASIDAGIGPVCLDELKAQAANDQDSQNNRLIEPVWSVAAARAGEPAGNIYWQRKDSATQGAELYTNVPQVTIWHSPTGFEIGYGGSGPADLALNILENYLPHRPLTARGQRKGARLDWKLDRKAPEREPVHCYEQHYASRFAVRFHQCFKREFLAGADRDAGKLDGATIVAWLDERLAKLQAELKEQNGRPFAQAELEAAAMMEA